MVNDKKFRAEFADRAQGMNIGTVRVICGLLVCRITDSSWQIGKDSLRLANSPELPASPICRDIESLTELAGRLISQ